MDPRDHGARLWDALVQTCQHALATDLPPDCHGARPRVAVTTSLEALAASRIDWATLGTQGVAITDDGLELTPATVRRLACDADLIPVVLGTQGEVLDVGRTNRLVTPRDLDRPGLPRPPLRVPGLHPTTGDVPRPPHPPLGRRRHHRPVEPGPALRPPPPHHPPHPLAGPAQPDRRHARVPAARETRRTSTNLDPKPAAAGVRRPQEAGRQNEPMPTEPPGPRSTEDLALAALEWLVTAARADGDGLVWTGSPERDEADPDALRRGCRHRAHVPGGAPSLR